MHNEDMVEGLPLIKSSQGVCNGFLVGKHLERRYEVGKVRIVAYALDLAQSDVSRPIPMISINRSKYFLTFIDDYSRNCWIYFLKQKSKVFETY